MHLRLTCLNFSDGLICVLVSLHFFYPDVDDGKFSACNFRRSCRLRFRPVEVYNQPAIFENLIRLIDTLSDFCTRNVLHTECVVQSTSGFRLIFAHSECVAEVFATLCDCSVAGKFSVNY